MWNYQIAMATLRTSHSVKMATKFSNAVNEDVRAQKDALENLNTQENIKKDLPKKSEKFWTL